ncbi:hypothetical protein [Demequina sp. NBRC 110051]|uniref:hypothetical protein n=1 Tax=Demequina sp. NBRC 110051 TaxID=1570340 RepID=UPI00117F12C9|nr:hypothetical protein [Demequina sp. NBRC 110051]
MVNITATRNEIQDMLTAQAKRYGYSLDEVRAMARSGTLTEPELRDLWLIWGDVPLAYVQRS